MQPQKALIRVRAHGGTFYLTLLGVVGLAQNRLRAFKSVRHSLIFAFNTTIRRHVEVVDFRKCGSRSGSTALEQF